MSWAEKDEIPDAADNDTQAIEVEPPAIDLSEEPQSAFAKGGPAKSPEAKEAAPAAEDASEDESGDEDESVPPNASQAEKGLFAATKAERIKRQTAEKQLAILGKQFAELNARLAQNQQAATPKEPDLDDDSIYDDVPGAIRKTRENLTKQFRETQIRSSERIAKRLHSDYDDIVNANMEALITAKPHLREQILADDMPAIALYDACKDFAETKDFSPDEAKRLKAENAALLKQQEELQKQFQELQESLESQSVPSVPKIPRGLNGASNVGGNRAVPWRKPKDTEIWGRGKA